MKEFYERSKQFWGTCTFGAVLATLLICDTLLMGIVNLIVALPVAICLCTMIMGKDNERDERDKKAR